VIGLRNLQGTKVVRAFRPSATRRAPQSPWHRPGPVQAPAFAVSGAIAGLAGGGAGYCTSRSRPRTSLPGLDEPLVYTVIAGIALLGGAVLMPIGAWILPTLVIPATARSTRAVHPGRFLGVRTIID